MAISAIYILDKKGRVLIFRGYRALAPANAHQIFNKKILEFDEYSSKPVMQDKDGNIFFQVRHNDLILFAVSNTNSNALMVFSFMQVFIDTLRCYFKNVCEESVRDNFVVIYELLDEMVDFGYPQTTEFKLLKDFIKTESFEINMFSSGSSDKKSTDAARQTSAAVSWRVEGIKHKKNEFFLDVVQHVSMLIGTSNNIIRSEVTGIVHAKSQLSGMPNLRLGLNDKTYFEMQGREARSKAIEFDDIRFHQCVKLERFENERVVTFVPPDGDFELFSYRMELKVKPLFSAEARVEYSSNTKLNLHIKVRSNYKQKSSAKEVEIYIPVPEDSQKPSWETAQGVCEYAPQRTAICWRVPSFPGKKEIGMRAEIKLPSVACPGRNKFLHKPINIKFQIPLYTVSGFQVRYLKIEDRSGYKAVPWVKYMTRNGDFNIRVYS